MAEATKCASSSMKGARASGTASTSVSTLPTCLGLLLADGEDAAAGSVGNGEVVKSGSVCRQKARGTASNAGTHAGR